MIKKITIFLFIATVIITIHQPPAMIPCPQPEPKIVLSSDGSYYRPQINSMTLQVCYGNGATWQEEWTDYPDKGGVFIRRIE
jgi:hypothetical protein